MIFVISVDDYNRLSGDKLELADDEAKKIVTVNEINALFGQEYSDAGGLLTGISNIQVEGRAVERENFHTMFGTLLGY